MLFVLAALSLWLASSLVTSSAGRALVAQRDNEIAATTCGVQLARYRVMALATSGAFGALGGSMLTLIVPVVSPDAFAFVLAVELITGLVIGGMTRLSGAALGALLVVWLPHYAEGWTEHIPVFSGSDAVILANAIYGIVLIVITFTLPGGLASGLDRLVGRFIRVVPLVPSAGLIKTDQDVPTVPETVENRESLVP